MPDFVDGPALTRHLRAALRDAEDARLAVAFWGNGAADALGITARVGPQLRVVCNLRSGGTNPAEIRTLRLRGAQVRQLNDLHAKLGVAGELSFLGSSNMSTNGLGAEGDASGWREANVVYGNPRPEIVKMFDDFWERSTEISETDLEQAARAWDLRRRANAVVLAGQGNRSLVDILRAAPNQLDALNVRMVVYDTVIDEAEQAILDNAESEAHQRYGDAFTVYGDWESMVREAATAFLVSFDWPAHGKIARATLYQRDTRAFPDFEMDGELFHAAYEVDSIEGITVSRRDIAEIRTAFHKYVRDGNRGEEEDQRAYNFLISKLIPYLPQIT